MLEVVSGCLVWIPLLVWGVSLVHWMIGGDIDILTGVMGLGVGIGLGLIAQRPPIPILSPIACLLAMSGVIMYPWVTALSNKRQLHNLDVETVERAYRMLGQRPDNPLAKIKLAESVYRLGMVGHAVSIADAALKVLPERIAREEHHTLKKWLHWGVPPDTMQPIQCVDCHTPCQPGWTHCRNCGAQFLLDRARGKILPTGSARKLLAGWMVLAALIVGVPYSVALGGILMVALLSGIIVASAGMMFIAFRPSEGSIV